MTDPETSRHVEVRDDDDRTAAVAEVTTAKGPDGTVRTSLYAKSEHVRPGDRAALVDELMGLPEVKESHRMEATVLLGDAESVERLRERTDDAVVRAAGGTTLLDATLPPDGRQQAAEPPVGESPSEEQRVGDEPEAPLLPDLEIVWRYGGVRAGATGLAAKLWARLPPLLERGGPLIRGQQAMSPAQ